MAGNRIMCSVNNCNYWSSGNTCDASQIMVTSDAFAGPAPDSFDASSAAKASTTPVDICMDTCCKTFVDINSRKKKEDKITKK